MNVIINGKDITVLTEKLSFSSSVDSLAVSASLSVPYYENTDFKVDINLGDSIEIVHKESIYKGIVISVEEEEKKKNIKAMDMAFYLNRNKILKQIRNTTGNEAIKSICSEQGIPINIDGLDTKINKVYRSESISSVIKDIIEQDSKQSGNKYVIFSKDNNIYIEKQGTTVFNISFKFANEYLTDERLITNAKHTKSIEELVNSVKVYSNDDKSTNLLSEATDGNSVGKYGRLEEVVELQSLEVKKADEVAQTTLKSSNKVKETLNIELATDDYILAGVSMMYKNKKYLVNSCELNFNNNYFTASLNLKELD